MATKVSVQLKGVDSLKARVLSLLPKVRAGVQQAVALESLLIETTAKELSPVDTGLNRAEIHTNIAPDGLSSVVAAGTSYAVDLEFGTRYMAPRPFLFPAYEMHRQDFVKLLKANIKLL